MSRVLLVVGSALVLVGLACARNDPQHVAEGFWQAVVAGDTEAARDLATEASAFLVEDMLDDETSLSHVLVSEPLEEEGPVALVSTSIETRLEDRPLRVAFHTHVVRDAEDDWRVDVRETRAELRRALVVASMRELGEDFGRHMEELGEALGEGARALEEALREALEGREDPEGERL